MDDGKEEKIRRVTNAQDFSSDRAETPTLNLLQRTSERLSDGVETRNRNTT